MRLEIQKEDASFVTQTRLRHRKLNRKANNFCAEDLEVGGVEYQAVHDIGGDCNVQ